MSVTAMNTVIANGTSTASRRVKSIRRKRNRSQNATTISGGTTTHPSGSCASAIQSAEAIATIAVLSAHASPAASLRINGRATNGTSSVSATTAK